MLSPHTMTTKERQPRSDALAHRSQLLDAALHVFTEQGVTVALDVVAERAGVSRTTLYRNFSDRPALLRALLIHILERLAAKAHALSETGDADALFEFLRLWAHDSVLTVPLTDYWRSLPLDDPLVVDLRARLLALVTPLLLQAKAAGRCREDLEGADLLLIVGMFSAARRGRTPAERLQLSDRAWQLITEGLRTDAREAV
ncbi:TetR/AcrR family transcriptional regulator [Comamonas piscis]